MEKIINGKRYNTKSATKLFSLKNNMTFYKKSNNEFFFIINDKEITPCTKDTIFEFCKNEIPKDKLLNLLTESKEINQIGFKVTNEQKIYLEQKSKKAGFSTLSKYIKSLIFPNIK
jgi:hypothetical protein